MIVRRKNLELIEPTQTNKTTTMTPENAREEFMNAASNFANSAGGKKDRKRLLKILQNNEYRDVLVTCVNEDTVIGAYACVGYKNDVELLEAFCDIGMNVDVQTQFGDTALMNASFGKEKSVRWLLDHNANVEIQNKLGGMTALMNAALEGKVTVAEMLLQKNANPDVQNHFGFTALMFACSHAHKDMVQFLLNYNCDAELKDKEGRTALDLMKSEEMKEMLRNHVSSSFVLK